MPVRHVAAALLIRLALVAYGEYQDHVLHVPYTDVDYHVFTGAAEHVWHGESPYRRATYRYTPLLAWLLLPTAIWRSFGKVLFCALDAAVGVLLYRLTRLEGRSRRTALCCAALWWYNPLPIAVCSRGNAESLVICLVLLALYLARCGRPLATGLALGTAVHMKMYPAVLAPLLYWSLADGSSLWRRWLLPNAARLRLTLAAALAFAALTTVGYLSYGYEFIEVAYLYHLTRRDVRHNFSVFYYALYLTEEFGHWTLGLVTFVPQALLVLALAVRFHRPRDLLFAAFTQTYVFVTFNKVCTSQYFLWYLSLLPPVLPDIAASPTEGGLLLALWYFAQASWLLPAYLLEFEGRDVHRYVWAESVAFFCANVGILARLVRKYRAAEVGGVETGAAVKTQRDQPWQKLVQPRAPTQGGEGVVSREDAGVTRQRTGRRARREKL